MVMAKNKVKAIVWREGKLFVAKTLGLELASQGLTRKEALKNLREAFDLLLENDNIKLPSASIPQDPEITSLYA